MSKKSYDSMSIANKNADNFIRTYNKQLEKAYRTLGAESTVYKNLIANTRNMEIRYNSAGIAQLSRSKTNLENYNKNNAVRELKSRYYSDTNKRTVNPRYNVQSAINTHVKVLKDRNIVPTTRQIKALVAFDEMISTIFTNYHNLGDRKLVMSDKIKPLSDIAQIYNDDPSKAYEMYTDYLNNNPDINLHMQKVQGMDSVNFGNLTDADFDMNVDDLFGERFKW